jgi:hypothetical protein
MMISGLKWVKCEAWPAKFLVLAESERRKCLRCEQERKRLKRLRRESRSWQRSK